MQKLNDIFKRVASEVLPTHTYLFERWSNAHEKIHKASLPAVIHIVPQQVTMELNQVQTKVKSTTTCLLCFFDKCPALDASGEEMSVVIDRCKDNSKAFLAELVRVDGVAVTGDVQMEVTEARGMAALAGVILEFKVVGNYEALCAGESK
jgi:hypothetical protein